MYFRNDIIGEKIVQRFHTMYLKNVSERVSQRISYDFCILFDFNKMLSGIFCRWILSIYINCVK